jgi:transcriptional regulator with GAF, ATPase, and Fis domain
MTRLDGNPERNPTILKTDNIVCIDIYVASLQQHNPKITITCKLARFWLVSKNQYLTRRNSMGSLRAKVTEIEKDEITRALAESSWIMARAARLLGITERMIGYKIKKYGIQKEGGRSSREVRNGAVQ